MRTGGVHFGDVPGYSRVARSGVCRLLFLFFKVAPVLCLVAPFARQTVARPFCKGWRLAVCLPEHHVFPNEK
ncbi:hypothetical protein PSCICN_17120 [Pseudomonas cichorii]|nr:hypothetical protein PSCICN_17120 [Pseudomonas cichorii]